jgi:HEAT repeat protein
LDRWLSIPEAAADPLELTLKVWSAYAGDLTSPDTLNLIDVYIHRMTTDITGVRPVLERIASNAIKKGTCTFSLAEAGKWVYGNGAVPETDQDETLQEDAPDLIENNETQELAQEENEVPSEEDVEAGDIEAIDVKEEAPEISAGRRAIHPLVSAGLLIARKSNRFSLVHPVVAAYLAGSSMAADGSWRVILEQPDWTVKKLTLRYCAAWVDLSTLAEPVLKKQTDPTAREEISIWNWLRVAPKTARWRVMIMRKLAGVLQDENLPLNLRGRALTALFCSRDPGTSVLFRQLLAHPHFSVKQLAALGCGLTLDSKAVPELITLSEDPSSNVRRAALMALGVIGTKPALDAVAVALLQGSDDSRRAAAEIFAYNLEEGHPALRDGSTMDDMLVRRAVVHGLVRVNQPWSTEILERMQLEDKQWIVRTAAAHAVEALQRPDPHIPQPYLPLPQTPWLIVFAGKLGMGVSPGKPAVEMLYRAISSGEPREKLAALDHIIVHGNEQAVPHIYEILFGCEGELQEAAYNALWFLAGSGILLPPPAQELRS